MTPRRDRSPLDDPNYPAYSMGAAAGMLNVDPAFLRGLGEHGLLDPQRSAGGHRRYSHAELQTAARAREVVDEGITIAAACRIVRLERDLAEARHTIAVLQSRLVALGYPEQAETEPDGRGPDNPSVTARQAVTEPATEQGA